MFSSLYRRMPILGRVVIPTRRRGAALPVVLIVVSVMTAVVVQFVHDTRTNLHMAANVRDEVRAYYNAKSGMELARLALGAQALVDTFAGNMNIQVWQYINQVMGIFSAGRIDTPVAAMDLSEIKGLGGIKGSFDVEIVPEDGKLNLNALADRGARRSIAIAGLTMLMSPAEHREIFEGRDARGNYNDIPEVVASLIDWVDPDDELTTMDGEGNYRQGGGAGESSRFGGFDITFEPRNAKFDTIEEAHLVKGVNEAWWDAFGEGLTVYPSTKINVNTAPPILLAVSICTHLLNPEDPFCDPFQAERLMASVQALVMFRNIMQAMFMTPFASTQIFVDFLRRGGRPELIPPEVLPPFDPPPLDYRKLRTNIAVKAPKVYKVIARGRVGNTLKTLTAVIDIQRKGKLYYWREF